MAGAPCSSLVAGTPAADRPEQPRPARPAARSWPAHPEARSPARALPATRWLVLPLAEELQLTRRRPLLSSAVERISSPPPCREDEARRRRCQPKKQEALNPLRPGEKQALNPLFLHLQKQQRFGTCFTFRNNSDLATEDMMCAITKRMTAIEEMAGMDVLCCDKTGTITLNHLTVDKNLIEVFSGGMDSDMIILLAARASRVDNQDAIDMAIINMISGQE